MKGPGRVEGRSNTTQAAAALTVLGHVDRVAVPDDAKPPHALRCARRRAAHPEFDNRTCIWNVDVLAQLPALDCQRVTSDSMLIKETSTASLKSC
jgi:hypothetical protein